MQDAARVIAGILLVALGLGALLGSALAWSSEGSGWVLAIFGWVLVVVGIASFIRAIGDARDRRKPMAPTLSVVAGEQALFFPRRGTRSTVASWTLVGIGLAPLLGSVAAFVAGSIPVGIALAALAAVFVWLGSPHQVEAGGLWATPSGLVHAHDGTKWTVRWADVRGATASEPFGITVGERPETHWAVSQLRRWTPIFKHDNLWIDGRDMAGDPELRYFVVMKALADPGFRAALGTPASLPPADA